MEKDELPKYTPIDEGAIPYVRRSRRQRRQRFIVARLVAVTLLGYLAYSVFTSKTHGERKHQRDSLLSTEKLRADYATCSKLRSKPQDPSGSREVSARYIDGHAAVLIKNATVWIGEPVAGTSVEDATTGNGYSWVQSDVFLQHGLIKRVETSISASELLVNYTVYQANGRRLTAGIVDMHSHAGVDSLPSLRGNEDTNELSSDITPYVRSIDGLNPLDPHIQVIKSGGVTTSLILPGSGNNMGGEAYVIKHAVGKSDGRLEISAEDMLADPEKTWRYMKMACGENPKRVYGRLGRDFGPFSRLGEAWYFRHAFEQASKYVKAQDDWCAAADDIGAEEMDSYLPVELEWESLSALLRDQVLLNTHCYTVPDLEAFVRHTNEFKFKVRAFHHAHQTYLVPEILKRAYGGRPPAAALFADNMYYKSEAYTASEQAGKILYENGITPVYVSDNPVLNAQHVVFEAAKAYKNGLPYHVALAGVTSASAELLGLGNRIGKIKPGFDADVVVWDSDPLSVGATPVQVWIDGIPQFEEPVELVKPAAKAMAPVIAVAEESEGVSESDLILTGVKAILLPGHEATVQDSTQVVIRSGKITCIGACATEIASALESNTRTLHLTNGHLSPPLTAFGSFLGIAEIQGEPDTQDGSNDGSTFSAAVDGLALDTKGLKAAYRHGVTRAISAPAFKGEGHRGISVGFHTGARHALEEKAVWRNEVAVHYTLTLAAKQDKTPSLSSAVGELREKLLKAANANETAEASSTEETELAAVVRGQLPLVITVQSADTIAAVLKLKQDVDEAMVKKKKQNLDVTTSSSPALRLIIYGGAESHLLAPSLAAADVGVVLSPLLPYATTWDQRRSLTGAPVTNGTNVDVLYAAGVRVAISTVEDWETRDLALLAGIAHANGGGRISEREAVAMVSGNVYETLGLVGEGMVEEGKGGFVVYEGSPLEIDGRVIAVADGRGVVTVW